MTNSSESKVYRKLDLPFRILLFAVCGIAVGCQQKAFENDKITVSEEISTTVRILGPLFERQQSKWKEKEVKPELLECFELASSVKSVGKAADMIEEIVIQAKWRFGSETKYSLYFLERVPNAPNIGPKRHARRWKLGGSNARVNFVVPNLTIDNSPTIDVVTEFISKTNFGHREFFEGIKVEKVVAVSKEAKFVDFLNKKLSEEEKTRLRSKYYRSIAIPG